VPAVPSLDWARAHETGSRPPRGRTSASDCWLNPSWTPSPDGTLNRPRGTSLERRLSGWIRTTGGPPAHHAGPAPTAAASLPRRTATLMAATGTQYRLDRPTRVAPAVPVNLPAGHWQASGSPRGPGHGWVLLEFGKPDHPADPCDTLAGPDGKNDKSRSRKPAAMSVPRHTH
jgi:hypothetical protein